MFKRSISGSIKSIPQKLFLKRFKCMYIVYPLNLLNSLHPFRCHFFMCCFGIYFISILFFFFSFVLFFHLFSISTKLIQQHASNIRWTTWKIYRLTDKTEYIWISISFEFKSNHYSVILFYFSHRWCWYYFLFFCVFLFYLSIFGISTEKCW